MFEIRNVTVPEGVKVALTPLKETRFAPEIRAFDEDRTGPVPVSTVRITSAKFCGDSLLVTLVFRYIFRFPESAVPGAAPVQVRMMSPKRSETPSA